MTNGDLRACHEITITLCIPSSGRFGPNFNRNILNVALLRLQFCSISAIISNPNPGAIQVYLIFSAPLNLLTDKARGVFEVMMKKVALD